MIRMSVNQAVMDFRSTLARVALGERVLLKRGGKPVAALIPAEDLALLERLIEEEEDRLDNEAADRVLEEMERTGEKPVPWEGAERLLDAGEA